MAAGGVSPGTSLVSNNREGSSIASTALGPTTADFEVELARVRLDQADQKMESLKSRIDYLEGRAASSIGATQSELEELTKLRDELGISAANVGGLSNRIDQLTQEPGAWLAWDAWDEYR